jgi:pyridoxine 4-dehydrogenase
MRREGKLRHVGLSNVTVEQLEAARKIVTIVLVQNRYSLADRGSESVLPALREARHRFPAVVPAGRRLRLEAFQGEEARKEAGRHAGAGRDRLAAEEVAHHAADPGDRQARAPRGEHGGSRLDLSDEDFRSL